MCEKSPENSIMVSIFCNTYNHEKYIRDALEGFVSQITDFAFEVLVHDDASPDKTAEVVREYEKKYPDLIKPIYQTENQYSKGIPISKTFQFPRAKGKYIALCEGDDYWIDAHKLQKQIDYMEAHEDCALCAHDAKFLDVRTGEIKTYHYWPTTGIMPIEHVLNVFGGVLPLASFVMRTKDFFAIPETWLKGFFFGDVQRCIMSALIGYIYYIDEPMSVYRSFTETSWSTRNLLQKDKRIENYKKIIKLYGIVDAYTAGKYARLIEKKVDLNRFMIAKESGNRADIKAYGTGRFYGKTVALFAKKCIGTVKSGLKKLLLFLHIDYKKLQGKQSPREATDARK